MSRIAQCLRRVAVVLPLMVAIPAVESLVCRGHDATTAATATSNASGRQLAFGEGFADQRRMQRVWFALAGNHPEAGAQALAHALDCWWATSGPTIVLLSNHRLPVLTQQVRAYPILPGVTVSTVTPLINRLCEPWCGPDSAIAWDSLTKSWSATFDAAGQARLEQLLVAIGDPKPRAPRLFDPRNESTSHRLARPPSGSDLMSWCVDLSRAAEVTVSLGPAVNPHAPAPAGSQVTLAEAIAALRTIGYAASINRGCLGVSLGEVGDRQHPAQRSAIATLPVGHLCRTPGDIDRLAVQLRQRVQPRDWDLPGWGLAALPWHQTVLVAGDPAAIHAVMDTLDAIDVVGLEQWLR